MVGDWWTATCWRHRPGGLLICMLICKPSVRHPGLARVAGALSWRGAHMDVLHVRRRDFPRARDDVLAEVDQLLFFTAQLPHRRCERRRRLQKVGCVPPGLSVQILKRCGAQTMTAKSQLRALI